MTNMFYSRPKVFELNKPLNPWFTPALSKIKSARRLLKRIWLTNRSSHNLDIFCTATNSYRRAIIRAKKVFNSSLISSSSSSSSSDPRKLWNSISKLRHRKPVPQLPSTIDFKSLSSVFASFFSDQVLKIHSALGVACYQHLSSHRT